MDINCKPCHDRIEHARQVLHDDISQCLAHHGLTADIDIRIREDERLADSSLSQLDRVWQWIIRRTS